MAIPQTLAITTATISQIQHALATTNLTSVDLVASFLHRIGKLDHRGVRQLPRSRTSPSPPEGVPFTIKDSFQAKGLTVAAGSPAFEHLESSSDAAVVKLLRDAGAVLVEKTNMPPMADGGSQRGLYGRSLSPYNPEYLCTSFASGSSHGSGVATAASFARLGSETVSSGRAPASHKALVGYSPSRGVIPSRRLWPLYLTCDVVVPHTKSVSDMLALLNIVTDDPRPTGDFWREQTTTSSGYSVVCTDATLLLWERARADLESLGATVVETDLPMVENYCKKLFDGQAANVPGMPSSWMDTERCQMIAIAWDDFLKYNADPRCSRFASVDVHKINPGFAPMDDPAESTEQQNHVHYAEMLEHFSPSRRPARETWKPGWTRMATTPKYSPTNGDVGRADAEEDRGSMLHALQDGVKYSNGDRAMKHLGIPAVSVPMGKLPDKGIPVGLTFAGRAWSDNDLLRYAFAYEAATRRREDPSGAPRLPTDALRLSQGSLVGTAACELIVEEIRVDRLSGTELKVRNVLVRGKVKAIDAAVCVESIQVYVNGCLSDSAAFEGGNWSWRVELRRERIADKYPTPGKKGCD
ncbi:amidase family protein [Colletotrichum sojae]|uniref:Amidase family protein n=1 Tax=Colletotrichum sojae TaxID=2175907 RepID=A0A8H6MTM2_9PEZI|nr:amidase family protein [Colletotrichum sojae]